MAGRDTSNDTTHIPQIIRIVCLCVNFVRIGCIMAKYLKCVRDRQSDAYGGGHVFHTYRSRLIATYVRTLAAMEMCETACTKEHMKLPNSQGRSATM